MSHNKLAYIGGALLVIVVLIFGYFGVTLPSVPMPTPEPAGARALISSRLDTLLVDHNATVGGDLAVTGVTTLTGAQTQTGLLNADGGIAVDTVNFTVSGTTGAVTTASSLTVGGGFGSTGCTLSAAGILQCDGAASLGSTLLVTGTSTLTSATVNGGVTASGGITTTTARATGAVSIEGATNITGTLTTAAHVVNGGITASGGITTTTSRNTGAASIEGAATITGTTTVVGDFVPSAIKPGAAGSAAAAIYCMSSDCDTGLWYQGDNILGITAGGAEQGRVTTAGLEVSGGVSASGSITTTNARVTGAASIEGNTAITGTLDVGSTLNFGTDNLYPLGYVSSGYQLECGTTGTFTATKIVYTTGLTAVTFALVTQTTDEAATAATLTAATPVTSTFTIKSWKADGATAGDTGVVANWCAIGTQ